MESPISLARWLQETRKMRFEEAYRGWQGKHLTQQEAGQLLGVPDLRRAGMRLAVHGWRKIKAGWRVRVEDMS
jgi:hypothetical protein